MSRHKRKCDHSQSPKLTRIEFKQRIFRESPIVNTFSKNLSTQERCAERIEVLKDLSCPRLNRLSKCLIVCEYQCEPEVHIPIANILPVTKDARKPPLNHWRSSKWP